MARKSYYVVNDGKVYRLGKRLFLATLRAVVLGNKEKLNLAEHEEGLVDLDLAAVTPEEAKQKFLDVISETELGVSTGLGG